MRLPFFGKKQKKTSRPQPTVPSFVLMPPPKKKQQPKQPTPVQQRNTDNRRFLARIRNLRHSLRPSRPDIDVKKFNPFRLLFLLVPVVLVVSVAALVYFLHTNKVFVVEDVQISGNEEISDLQIISAIGDLRGKSMYQVVGSDLEGTLLSEFPYIRNVYVDKELPGLIKITVEERFPEFVYMNLTGVYLVDQDNVVVEVLGREDARELTEQERLILDGLGDPDADYVLSTYISGIEDDAVLENLNWDEVPIEEKRATLQSMRDDLLTKVSAQLNSKKEFLSRAGFDHLLNALAYDAQVYEIGDEFPDNKVAYSKQVNTFLAEEKLPVQEILWKSSFTIYINLQGRTDLLFTATRPLPAQFEALQSFRKAQRNWSGINLIDLRSEIIAVQ